MRTVIIILFAAILLYTFLPSGNIRLSNNQHTTCNTVNIIRRKNNFYLIIKENWNVEIYVHKYVNFYNNLTLEFNFKFII